MRELEDSSQDYNLLLKWLSTPEVCEYYEGKTKPFDYGMVLEKFENRAKGIDRVTVGIIEAMGVAIGFVQYYINSLGDYWETDVVDISEYKNSYGLDIVIGETDFWGKGFGTRIISQLSGFLFEKGAGIIFIAPQSWNKRAIRCYEKAGFKPLKIITDMELHDDEYKDGLLMAKTKDDQPVKSIK